MKNLFAGSKTFLQWNHFQTFFIINMYRQYKKRSSIKIYVFQEKHCKKKDNMFIILTNVIKDLK